MKNIRASVAEYERLEISERMVRGRVLKVKAGSVLIYGHPPYGYRVTEMNHKWILEIVEAEARIVRLIFKWYTRGDEVNGPLSMDAIRDRLTAMHAPTIADLRKGGQGKQRPYGQWGKAQIGRILQCETYAGTWHIRKSAEKDGKHVPRPPEDFLPVKVPPIINREVWDLAQRLRSENTANSPRNLKHDYLMRRRLTCGRCGASMTALSNVNREGKRYFYYRCAAGRDNQLKTYVRPCDARNFRADEVDPVMWGWLMSLLTDPAVLRRGLAGMQEEQETARAPLRQRLAEIDAQLAEQRLQLARLLDAAIGGVFPKELVEERRVRLDKTIAELERQHQSLEAQVNAEVLTEAQIRGLEDLAAQIWEGLDGAETDHELKRGVVEMLDARARVSIEDGAKIVDAHCILGDKALPIASLSMSVAYSKTNGG